MKKVKNYILLLFFLGYGQTFVAIIPYRCKPLLIKLSTLLQRSYCENLSHAMTTRKIEQALQGKIDDSLDMKKFSWPLQIFSNDQLYVCLYVAQEIARQKHDRKITLEDGYEAINYMLHGPKKKQNVSKKVAIHEAGHVLTEFAFPADHLMVRASAEPNEVLEGSVLRVNCLNYGYDIPMQMRLNLMASLLGGSIAEQVMGVNGPMKMIENQNEFAEFLSNRTSSGDADKFIDNLSLLIKEHSLKKSQGLFLALSLSQKVYKFLEENKTDLVNISDLLEDKGTIYEEEIYSIIPGVKKPKYCFEKD